jgi:septal ring factor EnvC (AmiA/AmiB activator)
MYAMAATPVALVDTLNALLEAEQGSIFRFMGEGYPYLNRATAEVRKPIQEMVGTIGRRARILADQIESLRGIPSFGPRSIDPEEQYLAFLSLKFLLPKLVEAKKEMIERYDNALKTLKSKDAGTNDVRAMLTSLLEEHREQLKTLEESAKRVATQKT